MTDYIPLAVLNDFVFCPYSIYLHQVYTETDGDIFKATPQTRGTIAHLPVDNKTASTRKADIPSLPVFSETMGIYGKIDLYKAETCQLIERKYTLKRIYRGHYFQLWGQYFCMTEMGYEVRKLSFYEISSNSSVHVSLPGDSERNEMKRIIQAIRSFNPETDAFNINANKCRHCIYSNLCDKTDMDNVYT